jgi:hypothetical protein
MGITTSQRLVRIWFGIVLCSVLFIGALLVMDYWHGELIEHIGWQFLLSLAALLCVGVATLSLPLLISALILDRKKR